MSASPASPVLAGKTALVTGAGRRLGRDIALGLARAGADLVVHYLSSQGPAEQTADEIRALGRTAWTLKADLQNPLEAERLVPAAVRHAGAVDILVNNASTFTPSGLMDFSPHDLAENVQINAMTPLLISRAFAAQQRPAAIINLLDCRVVDYDRQHVAYHLSKRMLYSLTRIMAIEFAPAVRVNAVAPGLILPPDGEDEDYLQRLAHTTPLNRHGSAADVTDAVIFLARSDFITGQVIYVDGGRHLKGCVYG